MGEIIAWLFLGLIGAVIIAVDVAKATGKITARDLMGFAVIAIAGPIGFVIAWVVAANMDKIVLWSKKGN